MKKMRKLLLFSVVSIFTLTTNLSAQTEVGQQDLSFGIGFGTVWIGSGYSTTLPPISVAYDYGLRDDYGPGVISVGGYFGIASYKYEYPAYNYGYKYTTAVLMARGAYHYEFTDNLDTYAGLGLGFRILSEKKYNGLPDGYSGDGGVYLAGDLFVGAKYFFTENFAGMAEIGIGVTYLKLGVTLRL